MPARVWVLILAAASASASMAKTGPSFTGRWLADLSTQKLPEHPDVYLVADGRYECRSCSPPRSYAADGKLHSIPGDEEVKAESVTILGPRSIRTRIEAPSLVRETTMTASPDNRTATYVSLDNRPGVKGTLRTRYLAKRVAPAPSGANRVSGSWQGIAYLEVPKQVRTVESRLTGDAFTYSTPTGVSYSARIGGQPAVVRGPYAGTITASVRRTNARTLIETRKRDGKLLLTRTYRLSRDGKSLEMSTKDETNGTIFTATYHRD